MNASRVSSKFRVVRPEDRLELLGSFSQPYTDTLPESGELDVALVLPRTDRTLGETNFLKGRMAQLAWELRRMAPYSRLGIVSYGSGPADVGVLGLTNSPDAQVRFLASIAPLLPTDDEGAILQAARIAASSLYWRSNCRREMVLFTDTHPRRDDFRDLLRTAHGFRSSGGRVNTVHVISSEDFYLSDAAQAQAILQGIARIGGGILIIADPTID
ncbi:MAG TPA: vWA domain-containing protein [Candidatus Binataceae bacterium]|nr:vWA domain-containing protein [Candidatus Binataceae bacterium]